MKRSDVDERELKSEKESENVLSVDKGGQRLESSMIHVTIICSTSQKVIATLCVQKRTSLKQVLETLNQKMKYMAVRNIHAGHQQIVSQEDFVNAVKRSNDRPVFHVVLQVCS